MYMFQTKLLPIILVMCPHIHKTTTAADAYYNIANDHQNKKESKNFRLNEKTPAAELTTTNIQISQQPKMSQRQLKNSKKAAKKGKKCKKESVKEGKKTKSNKSSSSTPLLQYAVEIVGLCACDLSCDKNALNNAVDWFVKDDNHPIDPDPDWDEQVWKERLVLAIFFYSTGGAQWRNSNNLWVTSNDHSYWYGVATASSTNYVLALNLYNNYLTGYIPSEIAIFTSLTDLFLGKNYLSGSIPSKIGALTSLTVLFIHDNDLLSGSIPSEIGALTSLTEVSLKENNLTGLIPSEIGSLTSLTGLYLYFNDLSGPIPPEVGAITSLKNLLIYGNDLTGPIPVEVCDLQNSPTNIHLIANCDICDASDNDCCDGCY